MGETGRRVAWLSRASTLTRPRGATLSPGARRRPSADEPPAPAGPGRRPALWWPGSLEAAAARGQPICAVPRSRRTHAACGSHPGRGREVLPNQALKPTVTAGGRHVGLA
jgi:hypothetical protein